MGLKNVHKTMLGIGRHRVKVGEVLPKGEFTEEEEKVIALFKERGFLVEEKDSGKKTATKQEEKKEEPKDETPKDETPKQEEKTEEPTDEESGEKEEKDEDEKDEEPKKTTRRRRAPNKKS